MTQIVRRGVGALALLLFTAVSAGEQPGDLPLRHWSASPFWSPPAEPRNGGDGQSGVVLERLEREDAPTVAPQTYGFVSIAPCRQYDSRNDSPLLQGASRSIALTGPPCNIPAGSVAVSVNIAVFNINGATGNGVFAVGIPSGSSIAWVNYPPAQSQIDNSGTVPVDNAGNISVSVNQGAGSVNFVVDVNGYYTATGIVNSLNNLFGNLTLAPGTNISITPSGQTLTVSASGQLLPAGSANQTLRYSGSAWVTNGALTSDGTDVTLTGTLAFPASARVTAGPFGFLHNFGSSNTFAGLAAGNFTMTGGENTAIGESALRSNTAGADNVASGFGALFGNTGGSFNTAVGVQALNGNGAAIDNTAVGYQALFNNSWNANTAVGYKALFSNTGGAGNVGVGWSALSLSTGSNNIGLGDAAGSALTTGSDNIAIGNSGVAGDSSTIRIGSGSHTRTFIGGIWGTTLAFGAIQFLIDSNGQMGTMVSSARYKEDIQDMGEASSGLFKLRPVTFRYKGQSQGPAHFGLIAEEVDEALPELVVRTKTGEPEAVLYHEMPAMLLNELQKQQKLIRALEERLSELEGALRAGAKGR